MAEFNGFSQWRWAERVVPRLELAAVVMKQLPCNRRWLHGQVFFLLIWIATLPGADVWAQVESRPVIETIQFRGNRRVPAATLRARIFAKPGDFYDENALRRDFMTLYNTGLFDDIVLRVEDGKRGRSSPLRSKRSRSFAASSTRGISP